MFSFDTGISTVPPQAFEEVLRDSSAFVRPFLFEYPNKFKMETGIKIAVINYSESELTGNYYGVSIKNFLKSFSINNKIINIDEVEEVIDTRKELLGLIQKLISDVSVNYIDKIESMTMISTIDDEKLQKNILLTFNMKDTVSTRETIDIERVVKNDIWFRAYKAGLSFAFI